MSVFKGLAGTLLVPYTVPRLPVFDPDFETGRWYWNPSPLHRTLVSFVLTVHSGYLNVGPSRSGLSRLRNSCLGTRVTSVPGSQRLTDGENGNTGPPEVEDPSVSRPTPVSGPRVLQTP